VCVCGWWRDGKSALLALHERFCIADRSERGCKDEQGDGRRRDPCGCPPFLSAVPGVFFFTMLVFLEFSL
jgi:hypothetical protein